MRTTSARALAAAACLLMAWTAALAQTTDQLRQELDGVGVTEKLGAGIPRDVAFTDDTGEPAMLGAYAGHPVLLSFNYTSCPVLCSLQIAGLAKAVKDLGWKGASEFEIVTVSINPQEQRTQAERFKQVHVREAGGTPELARAWHVLMGTEENIRAVADAAGFSYRYDAQTNEFRHQATLVVLTPDGRVSSYLHGVSFPVEKLRAALERAAQGDIATSREQLDLGGFLLNCIRLAAGDKLPLGLKLMRVGGIISLLFLTGFLATYGRRELRRRYVGHQRD